MQYTFQDHEVGPDPDGGDDDVKPTGAALGELEERLKEYLQQDFAASEVEAFANSESLIDIDEEGE